LRNLQRFKDLVAAAGSLGVAHLHQVSRLRKRWNEPE